VELIFDVMFDRARYCADCGTVSNAPSRCKRCGNVLELLKDRFIYKPIEIVKPLSGFKIRRGVEYEDGFSAEDDPQFPSCFCDAEAAYRLLCRHVSERKHDLTAVRDGMFTRIIGTVSVWVETNGNNLVKDFWLIWRRQ
jgi:hypothetical protein